RTSAYEGSGPGDLADLELVDTARDHVSLEVELDDPERVDDVSRGLLEQDAAIGRQHQYSGLAGAAHDLGLHHVLAVGTLLDVAELPVPPEADHRDGHVGLGGAVELRLVTRRVVEEP